MAYTLTVDQLSVLLKSNSKAKEWLDPLNNNLGVVGIDTPLRIAAFMAQTSHESADYTRLEENLNYGASGLVATWPSRFSVSKAGEYARQPERIANVVYALRMGNGDESSGDGWKYRGRGILQLTGKNSYAICSKAIFSDLRLLDKPDLLKEDMDAAVKSACWFWTTNNLNEPADNGYIDVITKKINGGYVGQADRLLRYNVAKNILGAS